MNERITALGLLQPVKVNARGCNVVMHITHWPLLNIILVIRGRHCCSQNFMEATMQRVLAADTAMGYATPSVLGVDWVYCGILAGPTQCGGQLLRWFAFSVRSVCLSVCHTWISPKVSEIDIIWLLGNSNGNPGFPIQNLSSDSWSGVQFCHFGCFRVAFSDQLYTVKTAPRWAPWRASYRHVP